MLLKSLLILYFLLIGLLNLFKIFYEIRENKNVLNALEKEFTQAHFVASNLISCVMLILLKDVAVLLQIASTISLHMNLKNKHDIAENKFSFFLFSVNYLFIALNINVIFALYLN